MHSFTPLFQLFLLAQEDTRPESPIWSMAIPFVMIGLVFYFLIMRPESRKRKETQRRLSAVKKNDRVVTIGGILGTVVNAQEDSRELVLRIDEQSNTKIRILRTAVAELVDDKAEKSGKPGAP
ncbi:MAG: preprotein translocase subunit YajC [Pirellulaceae bacterium]|jgi:preprotein translocase subunit YajC|nr:preprotein translocase subunit YajC [Pirellulaceae bacterium]MDP7017976.1 preprotein translocase subunit YajC [Pirellulaceae bacterium]